MASEKTQIQVGDLVRYWRGVREGKPSGEGKVYALAKMCGTDVAWIVGCSGCIALSHVEVVHA